MNGLNAYRELELLRRLWEAAGPQTKKQLAVSTGYSLPLIGQVVGELLDADLLADTGTGSSSGGRKPQLLSLNPRLGYTVGLDIGGANVRGVACDLNGRVLASLRLPAGSRSLAAAPLPAIERVVERVIAEGALERSALLGVGVAISGVIDYDAGVCRFCPNIPGFANLPVAAYLEEHLGVTALVDDSLRAGALAERRFGIAGALDNFLWVGVGSGIGTAIVIDGRLHRGVGGMSGELGHFTVREGEERCNCGNRGCLEVVASGPAIVRRTRQAIQDGIHSALGDIVARGEELTVEAIAEAARQGDKVAFYVIDRTGEYLGIAIAAALNLLGLQDVILAGGVAGAGPILLDSVARTTRMRVLPALAPRISVRASGLDDLAGARGAAWAVAGRLFEPAAARAGRSILDRRMPP